jgi:hypothetical protein
MDEALLESVCFTALMELIPLIEPPGDYCCTIRGLARMLDVSTSTFTDKRLVGVAGRRPRGIFWRIYMCEPEELPPSLQEIAGFNYKEVEYLPSVVINAVVQYYAEDVLPKPSERALVLREVIKAWVAGLE